jgi:hypothetical protein
MIFRYLTVGFFLFSTSVGAPNSPLRIDHPEPITYESILAWHQLGGLDTYHWPKQHKADDKSDEIFLGLSGYGRGMIYALFTKTKKGWLLLSDEIDGSHHEPRPLPAKHDGWHDIEVLSPTGRGGLHERVYTWNGKKYVLKSTRVLPRSN